MAKKQKFKHLLVRYGERDLGEMEPLIALLARQDGVGYGRRNEVYVRALTLGFRAMLAEVLPQGNTQPKAFLPVSAPAAPVPAAPVVSTVFTQPDLVVTMPPKPDKLLDMTPPSPPVPSVPRSPEIKTSEAPEPRAEVLVPLYRDRKAAAPSPFGVQSVQRGRSDSSSPPSSALPAGPVASPSHAGQGLSAAFLANVKMYGPSSEEENNTKLD
jgi:hypothetical protein